ncbi:uncharacterized protein [Littorina saxatilis]|uniref:uncharacterized protein n=1 Tax=Littorina saxatilis TaxID=31220 RepID=UPI0038B6037E
MDSTQGRVGSGSRSSTHVWAAVVILMFISTVSCQTVAVAKVEVPETDLDLISDNKNTKLVTGASGLEKDVDDPQGVYPSKIRVTLKSSSLALEGDEESSGQTVDNAAAVSPSRAQRSAASHPTLQHRDSPRAARRRRLISKRSSVSGDVSPVPAVSLSSSPDQRRAKRDIAVVSMLPASHRSVAAQRGAFRETGKAGRQQPSLQRESGPQTASLRLARASPAVRRATQDHRQRRDADLSNHHSPPDPLPDRRRREADDNDDDATGGGSADSGNGDAEADDDSSGDDALADVDSGKGDVIDPEEDVQKGGNDEEDDDDDGGIDLTTLRKRRQPQLTNEVNEDKSLDPENVTRDTAGRFRRQSDLDTDDDSNDPDEDADSDDTDDDGSNDSENDSGDDDDLESDDLSGLRKKREPMVRVEQNVRGKADDYITLPSTKRTKRQNAILETIENDSSDDADDDDADAGDDDNDDDDTGNQMEDGLELGIKRRKREYQSKRVPRAEPDDGGDDNPEDDDDTGDTLKNALADMLDEMVDNEEGASGEHLRRKRSGKDQQPQRLKRSVRVLDPHTRFVSKMRPSRFDGQKRSSPVIRLKRSSPVIRQILQEMEEEEAEDEEDEITGDDLTRRRKRAALGEREERIKRDDAEVAELIGRADQRDEDDADDQEAEETKLNDIALDMAADSISQDSEEYEDDDEAEETDLPHVVKIRSHSKDMVPPATHLIRGMTPSADSPASDSQNQKRSNRKHEIGTADAEPRIINKRHRRHLKTFLAEIPEDSNDSDGFNIPQSHPRSKVKPRIATSSRKPITSTTLVPPSYLQTLTNKNTKPVEKPTTTETPSTKTGSGRSQVKNASRSKRGKRSISIRKRKREESAGWHPISDYKAKLLALPEGWIRSKRHASLGSAGGSNDQSAARPRLSSGNIVNPKNVRWRRSVTSDEAKNAASSRLLKRSVVLIKPAVDKVKVNAEDVVSQYKDADRTLEDILTNALGQVPNPAETPVPIIVATVPDDDDDDDDDDEDDNVMEKDAEDLKKFAGMLRRQKEESQPSFVALSSVTSLKDEHTKAKKKIRQEKIKAQISLRKQKLQAKMDMALEKQKAQEHLQMEKDMAKEELRQEKQKAKLALKEEERKAKARIKAMLDYPVSRSVRDTSSGLKAQLTNVPEIAQQNREEESMNESVTLNSSHSVIPHHIPPFAASPTDKKRKGNNLMDPETKAQIVAETARDVETAVHNILKRVGDNIRNTRDIEGDVIQVLFQPEIEKQLQKEHATESNAPDAKTTTTVKIEENDSIDEEDSDDDQGDDSDGDKKRDDGDDGDDDSEGSERKRRSVEGKDYYTDDAFTEGDEDTEEEDEHDRELKDKEDVQLIRRSALPPTGNAAHRLAPAATVPRGVRSPQSPSPPETDDEDEGEDNAKEVMTDDMVKSVMVSKMESNGQEEDDEPEEALVFEEQDEDGPNSGYTQWSEWGACSVTCGVGRRQRNRNCEDVGRCQSGNIEEDICMMGKCKVIN